MRNRRFGMKKLILSGALALALNACGGDSAVQHLSKAKDYLKKDQQNAAIIELKNAIKKDANLAQARLILGEIYLNRGNYPAAAKELERAKDLGANKQSLALLLARTYLNQGRSEQIAELINNNRPFDIEVETELLAIHALSLFRNGRIDEAQLSLNQAQELGYEGTYSRMVQASLSAANNELNTANQTLEQLSKEAPNNTDLWLLKGHLASMSNDNETAVEAYRKAVELAPEASQYTLYLAQALVKNKQFSEAEPYLDRILQIAPNHMLSNQLKAFIRFQSEDYEQAFTIATKALQNGSQNTATQLVAGVSAYQLQKYQQALIQLERVISKDPQNALAQRLLVTTQFRIGQLDSAFSQLNQDSVSNNQDSDFLSTVSLQLNRLGRTEEALQIAEKAASVGGLSEKAKLGLLKLKQNDVSGIVLLEQVLAESPNHAQAFLGLQTYYYQQGQKQQVLQALNQWLTKHPNEQSVLLFKGAILEQQERYDEALASYQAILKDKPEDIIAQLFSSSIYAQKGQVEKAYQTALKVKQQQPENLRAYEFLISFASQLERNQEVKSLIDQQLKASPDSVLLLEQKGRYNLFVQDLTKAIDSFEQITPLQRDDRVWQLLGDSYLQAGQTEQAASTYKTWLDNSPLSLAAYIKNINQHELNGELSEAITLSEQAVTLFKNNQKLIFVHSVLLLKAGQAEASQEALNQLTYQQQQTPAALQQQGYIYLVQQNWDSAINTLDKLYQSYPSTQTATLLIRAYKGAGNNDKAIAFIEGAIEKYQDEAAPLKLQLAELQMQANPQQALAEYQQILQQQPNNIIALNNLAWIYHNMGNFSEALTYAKQANQLKPDIAQIKDTYGYMLLKSGNTTEAITVLEQSYLLQNDDEIALHLVEALIANQQKDKAQQVLDKLQELKPELTNKKAELEALLN